MCQLLGKLAEVDPGNQHLSFGLKVTQSTQLCHGKSATRPRAFQVRLFTTLILSCKPYQRPPVKVTREGSAQVRCRAGGAGSTEGRGA